MVSSKDQDKIVPDYKLLDSLVILLKELNFCSKSEYPVGRKSTSPQSVMYNVLGYEINRLNSSIPGAGRGVFVTKGQVPGGSLVALYPGVNTYTYMCTCQRSPGGVFRIWHRSPALPYGSPNLPDKIISKCEFFLFEIRFLVHFCTHVAIDKDYFGI